MNMHTALDSLINLVTGLGGVRDKSTYSRYVFNELQRPELEAAYRSDWIARKVVDIPAQDATRAWRAWQAEDDQIEKLEEFERKFQVQAKVRRAMILARLYGGAALVLGVDGTGDASTELDLERIKLDSFKFLHVVHRYELRCEELEEDVMSPYYAEPKFYERHGIVTGVPTRIHPSRIVRLIGSEVPDRTLSTDGGWGDSILQVVNDAVMAAGSVAAGVAFMVHEAKIDVIKIPGLSKNLTTKEYAGRLINRFAYANQAKGLTNTLMIDSLEEWERIHQKFDTLPDVLKMYFLIASGAADIPATRFLGQSPAGLSSTGESDIRNYYDRIGSDQINYLQPTLSTRADEVIIRSVLGSRPEEIHYRWNPLWQLDDLQKADLWNKKAQTFKVDADLGMISPEALREVRENQLIEDGVYPGLEQALEDFPDEDMEEEPDELALVQTEQERVKLERMKKGQPPIPSDKPKLKVVGKDGVEVEDYNPNHDPDTGEFSEGGGSGGGGGEKSFKFSEGEIVEHKTSGKFYRIKSRRSDDHRKLKGEIGYTVIGRKNGEDFGPVRLMPQSTFVRRRSRDAVADTKPRTLLGKDGVEIEDYNENHDPDDGRFTSGGGSGSGSLTKGGGKLSERESDAVDNYVDLGESMNKVLRGQMKGDAETKSHINALNRLINRSTITRDATVYRGVGGKKLDSIAFNKALGKTITFKGFTSASRDEKVASGFGKTMLEIQVPKGKRALDLSKYQGEREILLPHKARFKVLAVRGKRVKLRYL